MATIAKPAHRELCDYLSEISERADVRAGSPLPSGTKETGWGVNFAIFGRHANHVRLELSDHPEDAAPSRVIDLNSARNRTGDVWHAWVKGIGPGQLYASGKGPEGSINFVICHDGFTLNDLVSYRYKHNEAKGEKNRDGTDANFSENYGSEGETRIPVLRYYGSARSRTSY